jgi:pimeloyl-ACP methyl ester carboxylesterase
MVIATLRPGLIKSAVLNDVGPYLSATALARIASYGSLEAGPYDTWDEAATYARGINSVAFPHFELADWLIFAKRLFQQGADGKIRLAYDNAIFDVFKAAPANAAPFDMSIPYGALSAGRKILLIRGAISALLQSTDADRMQAMSGDFTRIEVPGIGHAPMLTEPEARSAVLEFLAAQD